jgi:peptidyl-dipeptidase A
MYENPDVDLNSLWWELVSEYQMIRRPENSGTADWAAKIHIATSPCYYHNYLLGEVFASQLHYSILTRVLKQKNANPNSYYNRKEVGAYLIENVFMPGSRYKWQDLVKYSTTEPLTAKYYALQFVGK